MEQSGFTTARRASFEVSSDVEKDSGARKNVFGDYSRPVMLVTCVFSSLLWEAWGDGCRHPCSGFTTTAQSWHEK